jgi:hypothetical protein
MSRHTSQYMIKGPSARCLRVDDGTEKVPEHSPQPGRITFDNRVYPFVSRIGRSILHAARICRSPQIAPRRKRRQNRKIHGLEKLGVRGRSRSLAHHQPAEQLMRHFSIAGLKRLVLTVAGVVCRRTVIFWPRRLKDVEN